MWSNMLQLDGDIIMKGVPNRYSNSIGYNDGDSELMNDHGPSVVKIGSWWKYFVKASKIYVVDLRRKLLGS
jgi:hypothetical protein